MNEAKEKYKYKYYFLPNKCFAFGDISICNQYETSGKIVVREKIDLDKGLFSNDGTGAFTFVEFPGYGINSVIDGVDLYGNGSIYILRSLLKQIPLHLTARDMFEEQIEQYVNAKKKMKVTKNPKVGDVWQFQDDIFHIIRKEKLSDGNYAVQYIYKGEDGVFRLDTDREDVFTINFTYLGKAKGSISDLFEIKE